MFSDKPTLEQACEDFRFMRNHSPFRFSGTWYVSKTAEGFTTYRTKKAAVKHSTTGDVWKLEFGK